jgi:hypothetical protein
VSIDAKTRVTRLTIYSHHLQFASLFVYAGTETYIEPSPQSSVCEMKEDGNDEEVVGKTFD